MEERITELELRFMQQENTIQELNDAVYRQEQMIERLLRDVDHLSRQLMTISSGFVKGNNEEEPPPHY